MLNLSRNPGDRIVIQCGGEIITVTIVSVNRSKQVKLGIEASRHVIIDREEVHLSKMRDRESKNE